MMNSTFSSNILLILKREETIQKVTSLLSATNCFIAVENDLGSAITRSQNNSFDVIVLDASVAGLPIERTIQILKDIDPKVKIIITAKLNSKSLEAKVRQEKIYYYHLDSFGFDDLKLAIQCALKNESVNPIIPVQL
jgi:DNA-binding NarL/FixJ family response regulator